MNKNVIKRILLGEKISEKEYNELLVDYIKETKNSDVTPEQLVVIKTLIHQGVFNMSYVLEEAARMTNLQIDKLIDMNSGTIIKIFVYES